MGVALVFAKKKQNYRTRNACQSQDGGFQEDFFAVCPETWVALDAANLVTFFAEVWQKCTIFFLVQPGPKTKAKRDKTTKLARFVLINSRQN